MTNEEREKHIRIANILIGAINDLIRPILMYQIEKDVTREALENYIKMLEQQPCEDCISREQTLKAFAEKCGGECACCEYNGSGYDNAENCKLIKSMPSVTPSRPRGKWIVLREEYKFMGGIVNESRGCKCSNCNKVVRFKSVFCPNCGADMRGDKDEME